MSLERPLLGRTRRTRLDPTRLAVEVPEPELRRRVAGRPDGLLVPLEGQGDVAVPKCLCRLGFRLLGAGAEREEPEREDEEHRSDSTDPKSSR